MKRKKELITIYILITIFISLQIVTGIDSDNDRIDDSIDLCPITPAGMKVNDYGCSIIRWFGYIQPIWNKVDCYPDDEQCGKIVLTDSSQEAYQDIPFYIKQNTYYEVMFHARSTDGDVRLITEIEGIPTSKKFTLIKESFNWIKVRYKFFTETNEGWNKKLSFSSPDNINILIDNIVVKEIIKEPLVLRDSCSICGCPQGLICSIFGECIEPKDPVLDEDYRKKSITKTRDNLCELIDDLEIKNVCYDIYATKNRASSTCDKIADSKLKEICQIRVEKVK
ncbi:MAG: hypothetical protein ABIC91_06675 [Nanoarchaeota archaeon]|nr:hypothetical protein [Nanoarchaeota archaeon]MBU1029678.1 hypothetical protein [Nanoarchaeota archaeon]MBU1849297.1 hypothetical protein [Nanoarchaeota archaeon]